MSRGMVVDFAVHQPDREDGGIPNPHFHVLCPIRPIEQNGKWGLKQRRVYELDEDGNLVSGTDAVQRHKRHQQNFIASWISSHMA